jgi:hypothetical protein
MLNSFVDNNKTIVCAARQTSKTTTYCAFCLWYTTTFKDKQILILGCKHNMAAFILDRIMFAYEHLPFEIKPDIIK